MSLCCPWTDNQEDIELGLQRPGGDKAKGARNERGDSPGRQKPAKVAERL